MQTTSNDEQAISKIVTLYFKGTHEGDANLLRQAFHPDAHITGILQEQYVDWTLNDFIARVTQTPTPAAKQAHYDKKIIHIDQQNNAAMVKARVVAGDTIFTDYITLLKIQQHWVIRNKSFTT